LEQVAEQMLPEATLMQICDAHAAGPKVQVEPATPPPEGKQTLIADPSMVDCAGWHWKLEGQSASVVQS
jgi:hypothetical protein